MSYRVKGLPWSTGLGKDISKCSNICEAIHEAGLDYTVNKCELMAKMPLTLHSDVSVNEAYNEFAYNGDIYKPCSNAYATYRLDKNVPLGIVTEKYEVVQNIDAFSFLDDIVGKDCDTKFDYAGRFGYGEKVYISAKLPTKTSVSVNGKHDPIDNYIVLANSFDGSCSVNILLCPIRVFCLNMLNAAIRSSDCYVRIKHMRNANMKLIVGQEIIKASCEQALNAQELYNRLFKINIDDNDALLQICKLVLTKDEYDAMLDYDKTRGALRILNKEYNAMERTGISTRKVNVIASIWDYYFNGVAQNDIVGTGWGVYNAVTGYYSNIANVEGNKRLDSLLYNNANNKMQTMMLSLLQSA